MMALSAKSVSALPVRRSARSVARSAVVPAPVLKRSVVVRAEEGSSATTEDASTKLQAQAEDALKFVKEKWESTEDQEKPAAVAIVIGAIVAQIAIGATIDAVDKIPFVNKSLQLVGVAVTALFFYRYFTDPAERESVKKSIDAFVKSVTGDK